MTGELSTDPTPAEPSPPTARRDEPSLRAWVAVGAILFASGFCSLVYQVAWLRLLRLVFGASTAAQAAVVAIFMGGLGLGGYLFGRRLRRVRRPLLFYAGLELGIAVTAAASPLLVEVARWVYFSLGGAAGLGLPLATAVRVALSVVVLGGATTLMGGTLPAVSQAVERSSDRGRRAVAWLYGVNTLGAVVGALLTTFFFIEWIGVRRSLWVACLVNLLLVVAARRLARWRSFADAPAPVPEPETRPTGRGGLSPEARWVLPVAALVGFIFFLMELVWYRMLAPVLGGSSYSFGLILGLALAGIGAGGLVYAVGPRWRRPSFDALALTCALEAVCLAFPYALGDYLAWLAGTLRPLSAIGFSGLVASWVVVAGIVVLPASVVAGYQFPLLVGLLGAGEKRVGYEVGLTYAWNTWGAILGSLAGGFGLLPLLTAPRLWWGSAALLAALAATVAVAAWLRHRRPDRLLLPLAVGALALALGAARGPTAFWRHTPIGAGRAVSDFEDPNQLRGYLHDARRSLLREAEGVESSVALVARQDLALILNGKSDGSFREDAPTQVMSGLVGAILHPDPRRSLVIGLGTGTTAGWMAAVESMERVDVVELEPAVVELADEFQAVSHDALADPKLEVIRGDGREYVLAHDARYDLIFSEPSNPYRAGVAALFSLDFYRAVSRRLDDGGIFMQWLQGYEVDARLVRTVIATLASAFPHVEVWQVHDLDLLLVASNRPIVHDLDRVRRRAAAEPYASALRNVWRVEGAEGFYSGFVANERLAAAIAADPVSEVSTDDRPAVEYGFARNVGRGRLLDLGRLYELAAELGADRPGAVRGAPLDGARVAEYRRLRADFGTAVASAATPEPGAAASRLRARRAYARGELAAAARIWAEEPWPPDLHLDRLMLAESLAEVGDPAAVPVIDALGAEAPTEAAASRARLAWRQGDAAGAAEHLAATFRRCRDDGWFFIPTVERAMHLAEELSLAYPPAAEPIFESLAEPFAGHLLDLARLRLRIPLAGQLEPARCVEAFAAFEPHVPWEERFLAGRLLCYRAAGHPLAERAEDDLARYRAAAPPEL
jgi:spermidine synthase